MIPNNINRKHILLAIEEINNCGIPLNRGSRKYSIIHNDNHYPPKYVISLANQYANGKLLSPNLFNGGEETNSFLIKLGFNITEKQNVGQPESSKTKKKKIIPSARRKHSERCPECKKTVEKLLQEIYGKVEANHKFDAGVLPSDYSSSPYHQDIIRIYQSLRGFRGYREFVRANNLPRVDYYVPDPGFIVEFDESQHFTACRKHSLFNYPPDFIAGFDIPNWIALCDKHNAKDNDPPFRDEQRAWYDTLRDFLPSTQNLLPTIRLYSNRMRWCSLNPKNTRDQQRFMNILKENTSSWNIALYQDMNPTLARIIIEGKWDGKVEKSRKLLLDICDSWPADIKTIFLITCGAFITFEWPDSLFSVVDNKFPTQNMINQLIQTAENECRLLINDEFRKKLASCTDYITIGIDSYKKKISLSNVSIRQPHVELVVLIDLKSGKYYWTGKSYPTTGQENGLVRLSDLTTHFVDLPDNKVMLLGCHDLNIFSPRGEAVTKTEWRKKVRSGFYKISREIEPDTVLHHPHTTDSSMIWTSAWNKLLKSIPSVKHYISAGRYYREGLTQRSHINDVRRNTKLGNSLDFVIRIDEGSG